MIAALLYRRHIHPSVFLFMYCIFTTSAVAAEYHRLTSPQHTPEGATYAGRYIVPRRNIRLLSQKELGRQHTRTHTCTLTHTYPKVPTPLPSHGFARSIFTCTHEFGTFLLFFLHRPPLSLASARCRVGSSRFDSTPFNSIRLKN